MQQISLKVLFFSDIIIVHLNQRPTQIVDKQKITYITYDLVVDADVVFTRNIEYIVHRGKAYFLVEILATRFVLLLQNSKYEHYH